MSRKITLLFFFVITSLFSFAQGKLMLVGGGGEVDDVTERGGWSKLPYTWAVEKSVNKKVAVISYSNEDNWIPNYFKSLGALEADNIKIDSRALADLQATYDQLMQYDVFFLKGGDQSVYYNYYKDTKTATAIIDKFNEGGVISGTSAGLAVLTKIIYTATQGSVTPDEALRNFRREKVTLANDFLPFLPGYIADSHFTERGRAPRLMAFIGKWLELTEETITGIGVDDRTAVCIDENNIGIVYGTGAISIFDTPQFSDGAPTLINRPVADSIHTTLLLHGHTYNFSTHEIVNGPQTPLTPLLSTENGNYTVLLSGSEEASSNEYFFDHFVRDIGQLSDKIILVTSSGKASTIKQKLTNMGASYVLVETTTANNSDEQWLLRNEIRNAKKILFAENNDQTLFNFLSGGSTGQLLNNHIRRNDIVSGFIGNDSRYAGTTFITNLFTDASAAYRGRFAYSDGLNLLQSTAVVPNAYPTTSTDYYENTSAAIPHALVQQKLKYGLVLNRNTYLKFTKESGKNYFSAKADLSTLVLINSGTTAETATQSINTTGTSRHYVAFANMRYVLLNADLKIKVGQPVTTTDTPYEFETEPIILSSEKVIESTLLIYPNPSTTGMFAISVKESADHVISYTLFDALGRKIKAHNFNKSLPQQTIDITSFIDGVYTLHIKTTQQTLIHKVVKQH